MIETYDLSRIPDVDRRRFLAIGRRDGNLVHVDTEHPQFVHGTTLSTPICQRCDGPHVVSDCPIPPGLTREHARRMLLRPGCCDPPDAG